MVVFKEDSFTLLFVLVFLAIESIFGLIWALQPLFKTANMGVLIFGLVFWLSYYAAYLVNQKSPVISTEV